MQFKFCTETTLILRNRSANQESKLVIFKCKLVYRNYMSSFCPRFEKVNFQYLYSKGCHFAGLCKIVSFLKTNFLGIVHQTFKLSRI